MFACCLGFYVPLEDFSCIHMETSPLPVKGFKFFYLTRHSWPLSSEGSLLCHTYCDMGHPFVMIISEEQWHSHLLPSVWQWSCHYLFLQLRSVAAGILTPNLPRTGQKYAICDIESIFKIKGNCLKTVEVILHWLTFTAHPLPYSLSKFCIQLCHQGREILFCKVQLYFQNSLSSAHLLFCTCWLVGLYTQQ